ncbi:MAG: sulfide:quinone oxidoreductase, partial [Solirubrobacteraceae bacterium]|nr:sulfide:quinone oxidoreductase [Solirubrobacteraceae bacterium]
TPFRVVIAGGGPAALEAVLALRELAPGVDIEVLAPDAEYVYRPLSVADPFAVAGVRRYPYERLTDLGVTVRRDALVSATPEDHRIRTADGHDVHYDALLVVTGALAAPAAPKTLTFAGPEQIERVHGLVQDIEGGYVHSVVFSAPAGAEWTVPIYELALQTAERVYDMSLTDVRLAVVADEDRPVAIFGPEAAEKVGSVLQQSGVHFQNGRHSTPPADRVVTLPVPVGRRHEGLPADAGGFLPVDGQGRVLGVDGVWAAGDGSSFSSIKQGGLATQQAEVVARSIAIAAGSAIKPGSYEPVLRGMLITGRRALFLSRRLDGRDPGEVSSTALWSPPSKIAGERLSAFLESLDAAPGLERRMEAAAARAGRA